MLKTLATVKGDLFNSIQNQNKKKREIESLERQLLENEATKAQLMADQEKAIAEENYSLAEEIEVQLNNLRATVASRGDLGR